jgi:glutathione S-transferase
VILGRNSWGDEKKRNKVQSFIHAAEGTFLVHALAITYGRWFSPWSMSDSSELNELEKGLAINVCKGLEVGFWLVTGSRLRIR